MSPPVVLAEIHYYALRARVMAAELRVQVAAAASLVMDGFFDPCRRNEALAEEIFCAILMVHYASKIVGSIVLPSSQRSL